MVGKKWIICAECYHLQNCKAGQARLHGLDSDSRVYREIGCFDEEVYRDQISHKQLRLF